MFYEIYFQSSVERNDSDYVKIEPNLWIFSKELKKWMVGQSKNQYENGIICAEKIKTPEDPKSYKEWNLAGKNYDKTIKEIIKAIQLYFIPIVEIYKDKNTAINYLKENCGKYTKWTEKSLFPMSFMIYFGGKEAAEIFLKDFIETCTYKERIINLYNELGKIKNKEEIDLKYAEFIGAEEIKLAYINGIRILKK